MTTRVLVLSPDLALRQWIADSVRGEGLAVLGFADGNAAFLCACGCVARLAAVVIDDDVRPGETEVLLRRLELLRPGLPTVLIRREAAAGHASGGPFESVLISILRAGAFAAEIRQALAGGARPARGPVLATLDRS